MNTFLLAFLPATALFLFLMGLYLVALAEKVRSRNHIRAALAGISASSENPNQGILPSQLLKPMIGKEQPHLAKLSLQLERANLQMHPREFFFVSGLLAAGVFLVLLVMGIPFVVALLASVLGYLIPRLALEVRIWFRLKKAAEQFPNVLDLMVNCFRTGYGLSRSLQVVAENYPDPWGTEFGKMAMELNLGATLEESLVSLKRRIPGVDVELFSSAMLLQKETGGNMAEILGNLSRTIRERFKLFRRVKAISAQGKLSATIVSSIPFFLMGIIYLFLPGPVTEFIHHPLGILLLTLGGIWMLFGIVVLYKIVQIEV